MIDANLILVSRLQFAITALYHFIFVPLTLGLSLILAIMETIFLMTRKEIWRDMVKFWGILFGINFAMGVATGIVMEFQFGTNWSYFSYFVGDVFGLPLAIEGLSAFFLEATFVGMFFFGWNKLSPRQHWFVTWMVVLGTSLSALWILIANGWMQHPVGAQFNINTMRMEVTDIKAIFFNTIAQAKFVHTITAGYVTAAIFVMSISAYYLLRNRNIELAKRSMVVAAAFGLASAISVAVLGDESGYLDTENQKMKLAAIEGMWETELPPASINLFGIPNFEKHKTEYAIKIPYVLGIIATRSFTKPVYGIDDLVARNREHIKDGIKAYNALTILQKDKYNNEALSIFHKNLPYLGYAMLLKNHVKNVNDATSYDITKAAWDTVPHHIWVLFWSFRVMVALSLSFIAYFIAAFYFASIRNFNNKLFLRVSVLMMPLPWIAAELGWVVAEYGRQPWIVEGILPTELGVSTLNVSQVFTTLSMFVLLYTSMLCIEIYLMVKYIRKGPEKSLAKLANAKDMVVI